jgi:hypothetical protein
MKIDPLLWLMICSAPVLVMGVWMAWKIWNEDHQPDVTASGFGSIRVKRFKTCRPRTRQDYKAPHS